MKDVTVLIVDDDSELLTTVEEMVKELQLTPLTASNGLEAMEKIRSQKVDLIITDLMMPEMDGLELIRKSRLLNPKIPIAVISGHGEAKNVIEALSRGAYNFVCKPFTMQELEAIIKKGLRIREFSLGTHKILEGIVNYTEINIPSSPHLLPAVTLYIVRECQWRGIEDDDLLSNISVCVDELLCNALIHGNDLDEIKKISVKLAFDPEKCTVSIEDEGKGFNHKKVLQGLAEEQYVPPTKRGLFIVKYLMDELVFNEKGNKVTLVKYLNQGGKRVLH
ncbi:MAG: response regulator [Proteobacteria bacterium]|nr:response regulator [Pseudomonadota bacterium]